MTSHHERTSFLDELDSRQNELIEQLDDLNRRIEFTINQHTATSGAVVSSEGESL
jgi:hypothetical protein